MAFWQVDEELATTPAVVKTTASAVLALPLDLAALLESGETPSEPRTTLIDLDTGELVSHPKPTLTGTTITQVLQKLTADHTYRLVWTWMISATKQPSRITVIRVVA